MHNSHLTAITRPRMSAPTRYLLSNELLSGRVLDFGCGRGKDTAELRIAGFDVVGYDPHFKPDFPTGQFDTIICNYVLNVLPEDAEDRVLADIDSLLSDTGKAFIAVRNDQRALNGYTSRGTFQRDVNLSEPYLLIFKNSHFKLYEYRKGA